MTTATDQLRDIVSQIAREAIERELSKLPHPNHDSLEYHREKLINGKQAAEILGLSPRTLANMRIQGDGPEYVKIGTAIRYRISDIYAYIDSLGRN